MPLLIEDASEKEYREALGKIADRINARERKKIEIIYTNQTANMEMAAFERGMKLNVKGQGEAYRRKIADIPEVVARWMERFYEMPITEIVQNKDILKRHPEWLTVEPWEL